MNQYDNFPKPYVKVIVMLDDNIVEELKFQHTKQAIDYLSFNIRLGFSESHNVHYIVKVYK